MKAVRAIALVVIAVVAPVSAHRLDEYLQAARLDITPDRVELFLDLTPGVAIAGKVVPDIDRDGNRSISAEEGEAYASRILSGLALDIDGVFLSPALAERRFPSVDELQQGSGVIKLRFVASVPPLQAGTHHLRYQNTNRPEIGVYLANALVPQNDRVAISDQRRSANQQELIVDYTLRGEGPSRKWRWLILAAIIGAAYGAARMAFRRR